MICRLFNISIFMFSALMIHTVANGANALNEKRLTYDHELLINRGQEKGDIRNIELTRKSESALFTLEFIGPEKTHYDGWYKIEVEIDSKYPFERPSIRFLDERPIHWFYYKNDFNLSNKNKHGLFYEIWSPSITVSKAIDFIKDSLASPDKYEDSMTGQLNDAYRQMVAEKLKEKLSQK